MSVRYGGVCVFCTYCVVERERERERQTEQSRRRNVKHTETRDGMVGGFALVARIVNHIPYSMLITKFL